MTRKFVFTYIFYFVLFGFWVFGINGLAHLWQIFPLLFFPYMMVGGAFFVAVLLLYPGLLCYFALELREEARRWFYNPRLLPPFSDFFKYLESGKDFEDFYELQDLYESFLKEGQYYSRENMEKEVSSYFKHAYYLNKKSR